MIDIISFVLFFNLQSIKIAIWEPSIDRQWPVHQIIQSPEGMIWSDMSQLINYISYPHSSILHNVVDRIDIPYHIVNTVLHRTYVNYRTSRSSAVPARIHFAGSSLVRRRAVKINVGPHPAKRSIATYKSMCCFLSYIFAFAFHFPFSISIFNFQFNFQFNFYS